MKKQTIYFIYPYFGLVAMTRVRVVYINLLPIYTKLCIVCCFRYFDLHDITNWNGVAWFYIDWIETF